MRKLLVVLLLLWAGSVEAQTCNGFTGTPIKPFAYEAITVSSSSKALTAATYDTGALKAVMAYMTLETASIRFRVDGGAPTTAVGHLVTQASNVSLTVCGETAIRAFRAIATGTDASLLVTYYAFGN